MTTPNDDAISTQRATFHARLEREREFNEVILPEIRRAGEVALRELLPVALSDTGQSEVIARFLLGLYNGTRFPFDLSEFRRLDRELFNKCQRVLAMDFQPEKEVHQFFDDGSELFESMARTWGLSGQEGE